MILKANSFSQELVFTEAFCSKHWPGSWYRSLSWSRSGSKSLSYSWRFNSSNWGTSI